MNNIKLLKAQCILALSVIEPRLKIGIENYIRAIEDEKDARNSDIMSCGHHKDASFAYKNGGLSCIACMDLTDTQVSHPLVTYECPKCGTSLREGGTCGQHGYTASARVGQ